MTGTLFGIGVGPGDPELLTLKAARLLAACSVVAYPMANGAPSLARQIAAAHISPGTAERPYTLPMSRNGSAAQTAYDTLTETLSLELDEGQDVAVLCEGDPLFYGSFAEIMHRLSDRHPIEVVPGITSPQAASAALPAAAVQRNASWSVIPAPLNDAQIEAKLTVADAAAILKLGRHLPRIKALLDRLDLTGHATYCERIGQQGQRIAPLAEVDTDANTYFALILIRKLAP